MQAVGPGVLTGVAIAVLAGACSDEARPGSSDSTCFAPGNCNIGGMAGAAGSAGTGNATCDNDPERGAEIVGDIQVWPDKQFDTTLESAIPYEGTAEVSFPGIECGLTTTSYDSSVPGPEGSSPRFELKGAARTTDWLRIRPSDNPAALMTLLKATTEESPESDFSGQIAVFGTDALDSALQDVGASRNAEKAQMLVFVFDGQVGAPVSGVSVRVAGASTIAYLSASEWSTQAEATGPNGLALAINISAEPFPGDTVVMDLNEQQDFRVAVARGGATYVTVTPGF